MNSACRLLVAFTVAACAATSSAAQIVLSPDIAALKNRVSLGCAIEVEKEFVVTNTTAGPIVAGTPIFIDIIHFPNATHDVLNYHGATLPAGGSFREGTWQATSCTAWIEVPLVMAPSFPVPGPLAPFGDLPERAR
jgi:hypothetical protein